MIDKFHNKNIYFGAFDVTTNELCGMICGHFQPPYSVNEKFGQTLVPYIIAGKTAENRLFAVKPHLRGGTYLGIKLAIMLVQHLKQIGINNCLISGIASQRKLYEHIGFKVMGDAVREGDNQFYPMMAKLDDILEKNKKILYFLRST